jgi:hypothetical protein
MRSPIRSPLRSAALLLGAAACAAPLTAGELFRCGSWVVSAEISVAELKQKCGEPTRRTMETQDVRTRAAAGAVKVGETVIERWVYERSRASSMVVTITDGVITGMESKQ